MSSYYDSFLNEVPDGWKFDRLKDIVSLRNEKTDERSGEQDYLELEDLESGTGRILNLRNTLEVGSAVTLFKKGDVLFGKLRPYLEKYWQAEFDGKCTGEILAFAPNCIFSRFLFYCIGSQWFIERCNTLAYGAKMPRVSWATQLSQFNIPLPPIPDQKRIAAYLDASCAAIDAAMRSKRRQINVLEVLAKTIINNAVTNGIRTSHDLEDSGWTLNPNMPRGWHNWRLRTIADIRYGLGQPPAEKGGSIPMIRATNVKAGRIVEDNMMYVDSEHLPPGRQPFLKAGEIIVVRSGAYTGDSSIVPKEYEGAVVGYDMIVSVKRAYPKLIAYALLSSYVLNGQILLLTNRAAQPHLNAHELGGVRIFLPSSTIEQIEISEFLDAKLPELSELSDLIKSQIEILTAYRKSLIHECVTGLRRVTDEDIKRAEVQWPNAKNLRN